MSVKLYMTSITTNREIGQQQQRIILVLDNKQIPYETIDLSKDADRKEQMRTLAGIPDLLPPQLFNGDQYCGDFQAFDDALEDGYLLEFLKLK